MIPHLRPRSLTPYLAAVATLASACDPNVVIGSKWGAQPQTGGSAGTPAAGGVSGSGPAEEGGTAGAAGEASSEVTGGAGGGADAPGTIYFEADHEDGSLAIWDEGPDTDAGGYYADGEPPRHSTDQAHSGEAAVEVTIDTSAGNAPISRLYRRVEADRAYYSAWFYLQEDHTPSQWWSIFLFRAVKDRSKSVDLWSVDLVRYDDRLTLSIFDHAENDVIDVPSKPVIPIAKWFQLEAYFEHVAGQPSRVDYWLDGELVLSSSNLAEPPEDEPIYWVIGNGGSLLEPPVSTLFIDDAVVASERRGP